MAHQIDKYEIHWRRRLGSGSIGVVYMATNLENPHSYIAAKEIDSSKSERSAIRELKNAMKQQNINHENVIKILHIHNKEEIWMFLEFWNEGDLNKYSRTHYQDLQRQKLDVMIQMAQGLNFLHKHKIAHRDIKPENVLIQRIAGNPKQIVVKLTDFGLAKFHEHDTFNTSMKTNVGTQWYKAPEFWNAALDGTIRYHKTVDVYALGLTYLSIVQAQEGRQMRPIAEGCRQSELWIPIGQAMFLRHTYNEADLVIIQRQFHDSKENRLIRQVIRKTTVFKPRERISAENVLSLLLHRGALAQKVQGPVEPKQDNVVDPAKCIPTENARPGFECCFQSQIISDKGEMKPICQPYHSPEAKQYNANQNEYSSRHYLTIAMLTLLTLTFPIQFLIPVATTFPLQLLILLCNYFQFNFPMLPTDIFPVKFFIPWPFDLLFPLQIIFPLSQNVPMQLLIFLWELVVSYNNY